MSHGSHTIEAPGTACPDGCVANHSEDKALHLFAEIPFRDIYGNLIHVSPFVNSSNGRAGVYVGEHELYAEDASALAAEVRDAAYRATAALLGARS